MSRATSLLMHLSVQQEAKLFQCHPLIACAAITAGRQRALSQLLDAGVPLGDTHSTVHCPALKSHTYVKLSSSAESELLCAQGAPGRPAG